MSELAFYFSNADKLDYDADVSEDQLSISKSGRKFTRPVSMYLPSHLDTVLTSPRWHLNKGLEMCEYHSRSVKQDGPHSCQLHLRGGGSCACLCTSDHLPPEVEVGNIEYKRKLINPTPNRFEHLVTQMKWRLNEGGGEAIYRLGVDDDGHVGGLAPGELAGSLDTLERMAKRLNATVHLLQERTIDQDSMVENACQPNAPISKVKSPRKALELLVRQSPLTNFGRPNICLAVLGGMDVGKSTLIGVLTDGELDNARGRARLNLFRHLHEVQSGRTSCLSSELLGFDVGGNVTNYTRSDGLLCRSSVDELVRNSYQLITLLDSAGHSKYQRTTIAGLARAQPVGALLVVSATVGLTSIALEHAQLAFSLQLPVAVIISKIDQLGDGVERTNQVLTVCRQVSNRLSQLGFDISQSVDKETRNVTRYHPLFFPVSAVTGEGIDKLIHFLSGLGRSIRIDTGLGSPSVNPPSTIAGEVLNESDSHANLADATNLEPEHYYDMDQCFLRDVDQMLLSATAHSRSAFMRFYVREVFTSVAGVPDPVVFGAAQSGQLICGHLAWLGPDQSGEFHLIQIVSLHHNRQPYSVIYAGQTASVAVRFLVNAPSLSLKLRRRSTTEQEEVFVMDNDENAPHGADTSLSMPNHQLLPVVLRRGMVLLSNSSWSSGHVNSLLPSSNPMWFQVPLLVGPVTSVGVAWSLEIKLVHRLSIFSGLSASSAVLIPPLPSVDQRVTLYAGCIVQSAAVTSEVSSGQPLSAPLLRIRFTRRPEYMEVGQRLILTWGSCAKAIGSVTALYDFVPPDSTAKTRCCWIDSDAHIKGESFIELSMEQNITQSFALPDRFQSSHQTHTPLSTSPDFVPSSPNAGFHFTGFHAQHSTDASPLLDHSSYETAVDFPATQLPPIDDAHGKASTSAVTQEHTHQQSQALIQTSSVTSSGLGALQMNDHRLSEEPTVPPPLRRPSHRRRRRRKHR